MTESPIVPVILCGGSGTRLWPRSRATCPKPFLPLVGDSTLFEATVARCADAEGFAPPLVVTGAAHLAHVEEQLGDRKDALASCQRGAAIVPQNQLGQDCVRRLTGAR